MGQTTGKGRGLLLAGVCLLLALAAACGREPLEPMRIGAVPWPGNELLFLAEHRGWLAKDQFRLVEFTSGVEVIRAFRNGAIEAACLTLDETILSVKDGMDPVILIALDESQGADAVIARPGTSRLADLKGKRIALQLNSVSAYLLRRALQGAGMTGDDVRIVNYGPDRHRTLFQSGEVDAVVTYEPVRTQLLALGGVELFSSKAIPGEIVDVVIVRRDYLEQQPQRAAAIHAAWQKALVESQSSAEAVAWAARRLGVTPDEYKGMLTGINLIDPAGNRSRLRGAKPELLATATRIKNELLSASLITKDVTVEPLFRWPTQLTQAIAQEPQ